MRVIDFHTHIFPDRLAALAMPALEKQLHLKPAFDGTLTGLVAAVDWAVVERVVVQPVASRSDRVRPINDWAAAIADGRVRPFGALHPDMDDPAAEIARIAALGMPGFKLHPEFQVFWPDEDRLAPIYEGAVAHGLAIFFHAGLDIGIPTVHSTPAHFARVLDAYPELTIVLAHMGGYKQWDDVWRHLVGRHVYLDTSFSRIPLGTLGDAEFVELVRAHGPDRVIFGSDGPWADMGVALKAMWSLGFGDEELALIMHDNAEGLLAG